MKCLFILFSLLFMFWGHAEAQISNYETGAIQFTPLGSSTEIRVGRTSEIGKFRLSNRGNKTIDIQSITFRNYGRARLDESLENVGVYINNQNTQATATLNRKSMTFQFPSLILERGRSFILTIRATHAYGRLGDTIQLGIKDFEDFRAVETNSGFAVRCTSCEKNFLKTYTLRPGAIYFTRNKSTVRRNSTRRYRYSSRRTHHSSSQRNNYFLPTRQRVSAGSKNISFLKTYARSKVGVQTDGLWVKVSDTNLSYSDLGNTFKDFRLYINGQYQDSQNSFDTRDGELGLLFGHPLDFSPNAEILITGRIKHSATDGAFVRLKVESDSFLNPEYIYSGKPVSKRIKGSGWGSSVQSQSPRLHITK